MDKRQRFLTSCPYCSVASELAWVGRSEIFCPKCETKWKEVRQAKRAKVSGLGKAARGFTDAMDDLFKGDR